MKKTILTCLLGILFLFTYAQEKPEMHASVIFYGGFNLTTIQQYDYFYASNANPGFSGGAMIRSNGDLYLTGGMQYVSVDPTMTNKQADKTEKVSLQYFQVPIMAGWHFVKSKESTRAMHVQLGASITRLLSVSQNSLGIDEDNLERTGLTVKAGLGADLWRFVVDFHYNLLLTHIYDEPGYNNQSNLMCWEFSVGFKIPINKDKNGDGE
jgi:hypothetical protein